MLSQQPRNNGSSETWRKPSLIFLVGLTIFSLVSRVSRISWSINIKNVHLTHRETRDIASYMQSKSAEVQTESSSRYSRGYAPKAGLNPVWLMAYPFTGSSVALHVVQEHTGYSMGTNYGNTMQFEHLGVFRTNFFDSIPIDSKAPNGPFKYRYDYPLPPEGSDILIKTHCSGFCIDQGGNDCKIGHYSVPLVRTKQFFHSCAAGLSWNSHVPATEIKKKMVHYNAYRVKKTVLLIRNPLNIVVARFLNMEEGKAGALINHRGLAAWCDVYDNRDGIRLLRNEWYEEAARPYADLIPCHGEFFKITKWYERALEVIETLGAQMMKLYFEEYENDYGAATGQLFSFLDIQQAPLQRGFKAYYKYPGRRHAYFTNEEVDNIEKFMNALTNKKVTQLFAKYFET